MDTPLPSCPSRWCRFLRGVRYGFPILLGRLDRGRAALPYLALGALVLTLFFPYVWEGRPFLPADFLQRYTPWNHYTPNKGVANPLQNDPLNHNWAGTYNSEVKTGRLSLWQPRIFAGMPVTEATAMTGSPGRYYPLKLVLHRLLSPIDAYMALLMIHVLLMGVCMRLYLREIGVGDSGALFGAVVYMLNGSGMVWLESEVVAASGALMPLLLIVMERFLGPARYTAAFAGAAILGMTALMGQLQFVLYIALLMSAYLVFIMARAWHRGDGWTTQRAILACFVITSLGGMLIAGIHLVPFADLVQESWRIKRTFTYESFFSVLGHIPYRHLVTLVFPDFFGNPVTGFTLLPGPFYGENANYTEMCYYMGIPALFAMLGVLVGRRSGISRFFLGVTVLSILFMAGSILFYPFYRFVPGMDMMTPTRMTFLFTFSFSALAGMGLDQLRGLGRREQAVWMALALGVILLSVSVASWGRTEQGIAWFNKEATAENLDFAAATLVLAKLRGFTSPTVYRPLLLCLASAGALAAYMTVRRRTLAGILFILVLVLAAQDLIGFGRSFNTVSERGEIFAGTPSLRFLQEQPTPFRVALLGAYDTCPNSLAPFGIEEVAGYSSFFPERINRILSYVQLGEEGFRETMYGRWVILDKTSRLFDLLNVRYLFTSPEKTVANGQYRLVYKDDAAIYENLNCLPRAFAVHRWRVMRDDWRILIPFMDSPGFRMREEVILDEPPPPGFAEGNAVPSIPPMVSVDHYASDLIRISADLSANGHLVVSNAYHPGWRATVNGEEATILKADYCLQALPLRAGRSEVVLRFLPTGFRVGLFMTVIGLLFAAAGLAFAILRGRRRHLP